MKQCFVFFFFQKIAARFIGNFIRCCHPKKSPGHESHHCHHFWQQECNEELKKIPFSLSLTPLKDVGSAPLSTTASWVSPQTLNLMVHYSSTTTSVISITLVHHPNTATGKKMNGIPAKARAALSQTLLSSRQIWILLLAFMNYSSHSSPFKWFVLDFLLCSSFPVVLLLLSYSVLILFLDNIIKHTSNSLLPSFTNSSFWVALHQSTILISHWALPNMSFSSFFFWTPIHLLTHYSETPQLLPVASLVWLTKTRASTQDLQHFHNLGY